MSKTDIDDSLHNKLAELLDGYFPEHKDCECSRCLAFIYGLKEAVQDYATAKFEACLPEYETHPYGSYSEVWEKALELARANWYKGGKGE